MEKELYTLATLYKAFPKGVRIPGIQREYVQGRNDETGVSLRASFSPKLVAAVFQDGKAKNGEAFSLDYVYGVGVDGALLPLDGQQRLTTLFLLAWLCGKVEKGWKFDYEARRAAQLFVKGLVGHELKSADSVCHEITSSEWFLPAWKEDPTVNGMLTMLEALNQEIAKHCKFKSRHTANLELVQFAVQELPDTEAGYNRIFLKMNARGKPLTRWENLKAVVDQYLRQKGAKDWRNDVDVTWAECLWKAVGKDIAKLNCALEKILRLGYARFVGFEHYDAKLYEIEESLSTRDAGIFYDACATYFNAICSGRVAKYWSSDRRKNALWGCKDEADSNDFINWISAVNKPTYSQHLRLAYLAEKGNGDDLQRKRRIILNLLDHTDVWADADKAKCLLDEGLGYLDASEPFARLEYLKSFSPRQIEDELNKSQLPAVDVIEIEKDDLVSAGCARFLAWQPFADATEVKSRLSCLKKLIGEEWFLLYENLVLRFPFSNDSCTMISGQNWFEAYVPGVDIARWRENIFTVEMFVEALAGYMNASDKVRSEVFWLTHLKDIIDSGEMYGAKAKAYGMWMFLMTEGRRTEYSIRLDCNKNERDNRLHYLKTHIRYNGAYPKVEGKEAGLWYDVVNEEWRESLSPLSYKLVTREDGGSEFCKAEI